MKKPLGLSFVLGPGTTPNPGVSYCFEAGGTAPGVGLPFAYCPSRQAKAGSKGNRRRRTPLSSLWPEKLLNFLSLRVGGRR